MAKKHYSCLMKTGLKERIEGVAVRVLVEVGIWAKPSGPTWVARFFGGLCYKT